MSLTLDHVALAVRDREVSAAFYGRFFGMTERVHDDDHLLILSGAGGGLLALGDGPGAGTPHRATHFGFRAATPDEVRAARAAFAAAGVTEAEWQEGGPTRVQVFDPDGYRVEIYAM